MKTIVPSYYNDFFCIADKCNHSCCVGWEIDVDDKTYTFYSQIKGTFGERICRFIDIDPQPHFILSAEDRCPFLNKDNLCDIIINLGEDKLCDICSEHPRFRNYYSDRVEIGLGLCCEAVAEIIINNKKTVQFIELINDDEIATEEEEQFFEIRINIIKIIQDRTININKRIEKIIEAYEVYIPKYSACEWSDIFLGLERLDSAWTANLLKLKSSTFFEAVSDEVEVEAEQLFIYFIYRHLFSGMCDGLIKERIAFAIVSVLIITNLHFVTGKELAEVARAYSAEIEYSEENIEKLLDVLQQNRR